MNNELPLLLSPGEIIDACGGDLLQKNDRSLAREFTGISLDSRTLGPGSIFLCQVGSNVDAHDFIDGALEKGCVLIIGENKERLRAACSVHPQITAVYVTDARIAAQKLATAMRHKVTIPVIAITGACGKTTTKDLTGGILRSVAETVVTPVNNNNLWGVPLTLFELRTSHKAAVIELGTNAPGEVAMLAPVVDPTITITTSIGPSHLLNFGSVDGVLSAETEHIEWLLAHERKVLYLANIDDPMLEGFYTRKGPELGRYGTVMTLSASGKPGADVRITKLIPLGVEKNFGYAFEWVSPWGNGRAEIPIPGKYNVENALSACALALSTGLCTPEQAASALASPSLSPLRSELTRLESGLILYNDCYNANPLSVASAFNSVIEMRENPASGIKRIIAVLGDMLELGAREKQYHVEMGEAAARAGIDLLLTAGSFSADWVQGFEYAARPAQKAFNFETKASLHTELMASIGNEPEATLILVKGSRGSQMDEVVAWLKGVPFKAGH